MAMLVSCYAAVEKEKQLALSDCSRLLIQEEAWWHLTPTPTSDQSLL